MRLFAAVALLSSLTSASSLLRPQSFFSNEDDASTHRIPTVHESAVQARRLLRLESIGTLSTVFPSSKDDVAAAENRPADVGGVPIGLMEYFGDCEPDTGNPTVLAIDIATSFKNVAAGSNITLSLRWHPPYASKRPYSAAAMPRVALLGHLERIDEDTIHKAGLAACFVKYHPDAAWWLPGNRIHESHWVRLVVDEVYWIGGFGDRAYIGWIPVEEWRSVTSDEIDECRLPGEKTRGVWPQWVF